MKFDLEFPNAKIHEEQKGGIFKNDSIGKCHRCKEKTNWVDLDFSAYICSLECQMAMMDDFFNALNKKETK